MTAVQRIALQRVPRQRPGDLDAAGGAGCSAVNRACLRARRIGRRAAGSRASRSPAWRRAERFRRRARFFADSRVRIAMLRCQTATCRQPGTRPESHCPEPADRCATRRGPRQHGFLAGYPFDRLGRPPRFYRSGSKPRALKASNSKVEPVDLAADAITGERRHDLPQRVGFNDGTERLLAVAEHPG